MWTLGVCGITTGLGGAGSGGGCSGGLKEMTFSWSVIRFLLINLFMGPQDRRGLLLFGMILVS